MKKATKIVLISLFSVIGVLTILLITAVCVLHGRISSMNSVKEKGLGFYTMNYKQNYHLDKALKSEIKTTQDLWKFISKDIYFGKKIEGNEMKYACSAFTTTTPDGKQVAGRNFDLSHTDTLCLYTHPKDGYASYSTVATDMVMVGTSSKYSATSFKGKMALLAAPYLCVDGMNEKGLTASLLDMSKNETHMETGKPDLIVSLAIRLLLDRAATVDEGINLLKNYDIQTAHGWTQHIFIADKSGDSAIVEWVNNEMKVVKYNACTNFTMSDPTLDGNYIGQCERFDKIDNALKEKETNTVEDAFNILDSVKQDRWQAGSFTEWSVVFNLSDFTIDYAIDRDYSNIYHLEAKDF